MTPKEFLTDVYHIQDPILLQQLCDAAEIRSFQSHDTVTQIYEVSDSVVILVSGAVRCYYQDYCGEEFTDCFLTHVGYPVMTPDLGEYSVCGIEALVPTQILFIKLSVIMPLLATSHELMALQLKLMEKGLFFHWYQKVSRFQYDAKERYILFLTDYADLENKISGKQLASYLGITPVSLSRLRKELAGKPLPKLPELIRRPGDRERMEPRPPLPN